MAVKREVADRVRQVAEETGVSQLEVVSQLLAAALDQGQVKLQLREVVVDFTKAKPAAKKK